MLRQERGNPFLPLQFFTIADSQAGSTETGCGIHEIRERMEDKNVLSESEEEAAAGGNIVSAGDSLHTCPNCGSERTVITSHKDRNGMPHLRGACRDCKYIWEL